MANSTKAFIPSPIRDVVLVGAGGTGSILAEHLCRMIVGFKLKCGLHIYDGDTVEQNNITRQNFCPHEIGANKAEALALRLSGRFGLALVANARHFDRRIVTDNNYLHSYNSTLIISCTDSLVSRRQIAERPEPGGLWLDVGNELSHGQVVLGTTHNDNKLRREFWAFKKTPFVLDLPDIAALNPAILRARKHKSRAGCGDVPFASQGFGVNAMAALAAATIAKQVMVTGQVRDAAVYFDVEKGFFRPQKITQDMYRQWKNKNI